jgi:hypothetical protein
MFSIRFSMPSIAAAAKAVAWVLRVLSEPAVAQHEKSSNYSRGNIETVQKL